MAYLFLIPILAAGAFSDWHKKRIPNGVIWVGVITGLMLSPGAERMDYVFRLCLTWIVFFPLFFFRMMGAGDIKLVGLVIAWLGWQKGIAAAGYGFFLGAVWSFFKMWRAGIICQRISYFIVYFRQFFLTKEKRPYYLANRDGDVVVIPFAVCIFAGVLIVMVD